MPHAAELITATKDLLHIEIEAVIAKRPEWRFIEQQRHLKDVVRLLLREIECQHPATQKLDAVRREQALNTCWLGLIVSQELQHPPQLTRDIFNQLFFKSVGQDSDHYHQPPWTNHSAESHDIQLKMVLFAKELYRFQELITWEQPWYLTRFFLPFLSDRVSDRWLNLVSDMMIVLERHDSLVANTSSQGFKKNDLHASHPLRKSSIESLKEQREIYKGLHQGLEDHKGPLEKQVHQVSASAPGVNQLYQAVKAAQRAWQRSGLLEGPSDHIELEILLYEEAAHQRKAIKTMFEDEVQTLLALTETTSRPAQVALSQFFEVN